ncbi:MFS-type transporter SLC18B1 [Lingula anatina]|uniref:MFS-type transporter SLC18B1 n=1 Tax=Lingula anatina TaxID=7574 RepID=A0A1S3JIZ5_LINAN|nr:MFS-type transporter SLC18B1 [Lingula anatina]|eukprot:XP_013410096.1 MFS-type transporter SLC18B1 [Lingula anatina]
MLGCTLLIGSQLSRIGPRRCYSIGLMVLGLSSLTFGFLGAVHSGDVFLGLGISVRVLESVGAAMAMVANYAIAAREFRSSFAATFGIMEMFAGLGFVLGPLASGGLYQLGGFGLPFYVFGPMSVILGIWAAFSLPPDDAGVDTSSQHGQILEMLKKPLAWIEYSAILIPSVGVGALFPALAQHLRDVDSNLEGNYVMIGVAFATVGTCYTLLVPIFGLVSSKFNRNKLQIITGLTVETVGFALLGPAVPFNLLYPNGKGASWSVYLGGCTVGIGLACNQVAVMADRLSEVTADGLSDDITTYGNLSALFESFFGLGLFIGPLFGGLISDHFPFSTLSTVLSVLCLVVASVMFVYCVVVYGVCRRKKPDHSAVDTDRQMLLIRDTPKPVITEQYVQSKE